MHAKPPGSRRSYLCCWPTRPAPTIFVDICAPGPTDWWRGRRQWRRGWKDARHTQPPGPAGQGRAGEGLDVCLQPSAGAVCPAALRRGHGPEILASGGSAQELPVAARTERAAGVGSCRRTGAGPRGRPRRRPTTAALLADLFAGGLTHPVVMPFNQSSPRSPKARSMPG